MMINVDLDDAKIPHKVPDEIIDVHGIDVHGIDVTGRIVCFRSDWLSSCADGALVLMELLC